MRVDKRRRGEADAKQKTGEDFIGCCISDDDDDDDDDDDESVGRKEIGRRGENGSELVRFLANARDIGRRSMRR